MPSRFLVDRVQAATDRPTTRPLAEVLGEALLVGGDGARPVVDHGATHPLLGAVHRAFAEHRPLVLTPDAVWLTIAQGVSRHVRRNAETLRRRLVRHDGKARVSVQVSALPSSEEGWREVVDRFRDGLAEHIGAGPARLFEHDFSTSTDVERTAGRIVLMDTYSPYYDFYAVCVCGVPWIRLEGTVEDWRRIRERVEVISELDLEVWARSLRPICDELVKAAEGSPTLSFWRRLYKPEDAYGGDVVTGWIARLYPYVISRGVADRANPLLALPIDEPSGHTGSWYTGPGVRTDQIPAEASRARVRVIDHPRGEVRDVCLDAGVLAVGLGEDGALTPLCAWALRADDAVTAQDVLERIRAEHEVVEAGPEDRAEPVSGSAERIALTSELAEARLFDGRWRLRGRGRSEVVSVPVRGGSPLQVERQLDLDDDRYVAFLGLASPLLVRGRTSALGRSDSPHGPRVTAPLDDLRVVGSSLTELLWAALESGGEAPLPDLGPLADHLPAWARPMG